MKAYRLSIDFENNAETYWDEPTGLARSFWDFLKSSAEKVCGEDLYFRSGVFAKLALQQLQSFPNWDENTVRGSSPVTFHIDIVDKGFFNG